MNRDAAVAYLASHRHYAPENLGARMAADFGQTDGGGEVPVGQLDEIIWRIQDGRSRITRAQELRVHGSLTPNDAEAVRWFDDEMGPGDDLLREAAEIAEQLKALGVRSPHPSPAPTATTAPTGQPTGSPWMRTPA